MKELFVSGENLTDTYHKALKELYYNADITDCPDYNQKQKEASLTMFVQNPTKEPRISKLIIGGHHELQQYVMEVLDGILDFKIGDGKAWEYTYHQRYKYQLPFIINELKRNPDSRRAVMNIRDFEIDSSNSHPACLQSIQYFIRENKLHCKILFRSNDIAEALYFNAFALIKLQEKVADMLGVEVGTYTHRANSMHVYEKDFKMFDRFIQSINNNEDITYEYDGFYKDLMEEEIPSIMENVNILKDNMSIK